MEIWKPVLDAPRYEASSLGRVKSSCRLLQGCEKNGYLRSSVRIDGKRVETSLHRLVALAFHPRVPGKNFVNHINGDRKDNRPENLEWVSHGENVIHGIRVLGRANLVMTEVEALLIRQAFEWGFSVNEIARARQLNRATVRDVTSNRHWKFAGT